MQTIKHRTIDAILELPDTAGIKDIENVLKKVAMESKKNLPAPSSPDKVGKKLKNASVAQKSADERKSVKSIFGLLKHKAPSVPATLEQMEAAIKKRRCERAFK